MRPSAQDRSSKRQKKIHEHGSPVIIHVFHIRRARCQRIRWTRSRGTIQAFIIRWKKCSRDLYSRYSVNFIDFWSFTQWVQIFVLPRISRWSPTVRVLIVPVNPLQMWSTESLSGWKLIWFHQTSRYGGFLKWWYPTTMGFPTRNDHFGVWNGGTTI